MDLATSSGAYASLHRASAYGLAVPRGSDLTPEENERVRVALRELIEHYGNQVKLAPKLGVNQSTLSGILGGRAGASYQLAVAIARQLGRDPRELLAGTSQPTDAGLSRPSSPAKTG
jgi:DNA-binding XRE family transcriptional regulator